MNNFEEQYYEQDDFWKDSVNDPANQLRIRRTIEFIPADVRTLVDLGCGNGVFLHAVSQKKSNLTLLGIDRSEAALRYVKTEKKQSSIDKVDLPDKSFDCVSCLEVIEHLPHGVYENALKEIARVSAKYVIISVPYAEVLEDSFNRCPSCKSTFSYEMHLRSFDDDRMLNLLEQYGFSCTRKEHLGLQHSLVGHKMYRDTIYPEHKNRFVSPICPICGYENPVSAHHAQAKVAPSGGDQPVRSLKQKITSALTAIPKLMWPKEKKYYWILCLFERKDI